MNITTKFFVYTNIITHKLKLHKLHYYILDVIEPKFDIDYELYMDVFDKY